MKIVKRISALFIGLALMVALPVTAHASTNDDQQDIASLDMSVIDVQIQSRGVMTAEDLYDFLQSDAEKTVDIDAETGKITAVSEGITKPRITVNNICNGHDSCLIHNRVPLRTSDLAGPERRPGIGPTASLGRLVLIRQKLGTDMAMTLLDGALSSDLTPRPI